MQMTPAHIIPISSDAQGVSPGSLRSVLQDWHSAPSTSSKRFPKCLYTVPIGANPTGTTAGEERKREVLAIAREFGILILEDDPYYFLSFEGLGEDPVTRKRPKSYFALENEDREKWGDGRVLRFESFSKVRLNCVSIAVPTQHIQANALVPYRFCPQVYDSALSLAQNH
jgi:tryptophan aminotransferase